MRYRDRTMRVMNRQLLAVAGMALLASTPVHAADAWVRTWEAPPVEVLNPKPGAPDAGMADVTIRMPVRISAGGRSLRLRLSNELTDRPLPIGAVHVAIAGPFGKPLPGSDRVVSFAGLSAPTLPPFAPLISDPIPLKVRALDKLVISIHVPGNASGLTIHPLGMATATIAPGDQTAAPTLTDGRVTMARYLLSGVDVSGGDASATIVTFGDSITDGALSTKDLDKRWPDILAERIEAAGLRRLAVANAGISGNRLLQTGAGPSALARLDRDVLSVPNVRYLIVLEGINDIGFTKNAHLPPPKPEDLIAVYRQILDRAHGQGVKVFGATILPYKGAGYVSDAGDIVRRAVNAWIRTPANFDGVIDLDKAVADPADALSLDPRYDSGDHLHPKDAGYQAIARAIDLKLFK